MERNLWTLEPGEGALIPVESGFRIAEVSVVEAALPIEGSVEAVPGVWPTGASQGMLLVAARDEPVALEKGTPVGELRSGFVSSGTCECGAVETILEGAAEDRCGECGAVNSSLAEQFCQTCGRTGAYEATALQGCRSCSGSRRRSIWRSAALAFVVGLGALAGSSSMMAYQDGQCELDRWSTFPGGVVRAHYESRDSLYIPETSDCPWSLDCLSDRRVTCAKCTDGQLMTVEDDWRHDPSRQLSGKTWTGETRFFWRSSRGVHSFRDWRSTCTEAVYHIVEVPGGIERMAEETPTDRYYEALRNDLGKRYPSADRFLLDHLVSLEGFLDKSIIFGFSYGVGKAELCRTGGKLLGHIIGRSGSSPDPERAQAVRDFAPLKEKLHIQQFLGSANWLRTYLPSEFGHCAKVLSAYQKPGAAFPPEGLGGGQFRRV